MKGFTVSETCNKKFKYTVELPFLGALVVHGSHFKMSCTVYKSLQDKLYKLYSKIISSGKAKKVFIQA